MSEGLLHLNAILPMLPIKKHIQLVLSLIKSVQRKPEYLFMHERISTDQLRSSEGKMPSSCFCFVPYIVKPFGF